MYDYAIDPLISIDTVGNEFLLFEGFWTRSIPLSYPLILTSMVEKLLRCHTSILIDNIQSIIYDLYFFKQVNEYEKMVEVGYFYNFFSSLKTPFFKS